MTADDFVNEESAVLAQLGLSIDWERRARSYAAVADGLMRDVERLQLELANAQQHVERLYALIERWRDDDAAARADGGALR